LNRLAVDDGRSARLRYFSSKASRRPSMSNAMGVDRDLLLESKLGVGDARDTGAELARLHLLEHDGLADAEPHLDGDDRAVLKVQCMTMRHSSCALRSRMYR
jgi:hypothetical protein